jgi:hypothetical protein
MTTTNPVGPIRLPQGLKSNAAMRARTRLSPAMLDAGWLATAERLGLEGETAEEYEALRALHLERLANLRGALERLGECRQRFAREDHEHLAGIRQAAQSGSVPSDHRTSNAERQQAIEPLQQVAESALEFLGHHVDRVTGWFRANETVLMDSVRRHRAPVEERRREAEAVLHQCRQDERRLALLARWVGGVAQDRSIVDRAGAPPEGQPVPNMNEKAVEECFGGRPWWQTNADDLAPRMGMAS